MRRKVGKVMNNKNKFKVNKIILFIILNLFNLFLV